MDLKIIAPINEYVKEFSNPDEFNVWYNKHKEEVDNETTNKLNKMYHIDGYKITKIKGVLMLKKWNKAKSIAHDSSVDELKTQINELQQKYEEIKDRMNQLIEIVNKQLS